MTALVVSGWLPPDVPALTERPTPDAVVLQGTTDPEGLTAASVAVVDCLPCAMFGSFLASLRIN